MITIAEFLLLTFVILAPVFMYLGAWLCERSCKPFYIDLINEELKTCTMSNGNYRHVGFQEQSLLRIAKRLKVENRIDQYTSNVYPYLEKGGQ